MLNGIEFKIIKKDIIIYIFIIYTQFTQHSETYVWKEAVVNVSIISIDKI